MCSRSLMVIHAALSHALSHLDSQVGHNALAAWGGLFLSCKLSLLPTRQSGNLLHTPLTASCHIALQPYPCCP